MNLPTLALTLLLATMTMKVQAQMYPTGNTEAKPIKFYSGLSLWLSDTSSKEFSGSNDFAINTGAVFYKYVGVEVGYKDVGSYSYRKDRSKRTISNAQDMNISVLAMYPMGTEVTPYLRLGINKRTASIKGPLEITGWYSTSVTGATIWNDYSEEPLPSRDAGGDGIIFGVGVKLGDENKAFTAEMAHTEMDYSEIKEETKMLSLALGFELRY